MKLLTWFACWPLLGLLGVCAFTADALGDACEGIDSVLTSMQDYIDE
jgi:hypothetical protein